MKNIRNIFFDADDTLWENHLLFVELIDKTIEIIEPFSESSADDLEQEFYRIQHYYLKTYGYGIVNFIPVIMTLFAKHYPEPFIPVDLSQAIDKFRYQMTSAKPPIITGVLNTLGDLKKSGFRLYILTKGNFKEQQRKIENSTLDHFFDDIFITGEKEPHTFRQLTKYLSINASETLMVGNSLKSDIYPSLASGWRAVWFEREQNWHFETPEKILTAEFKTISNMKDLVPILSI